MQSRNWCFCDDGRHHRYAPGSGGKPHHAAQCQGKGWTMSRLQKTLYELVRTWLQIAAIEEARIAPFNLSGRGHEPRVTLDRRLAAVLRETDLPFVCISGYGANYYYPRRVFERAQRQLLTAVNATPIAFGRDGLAYMDVKALPEARRKPIRIRASARTSRDALLQRGWTMRGAWAEKRLRGIRMVLSGRVVENGAEYIGLSFHPMVGHDEALAVARTKLARLNAANREQLEPPKYTATVEFLEPNEDYGPGFFASLMDGPSVDLFQIARLECTDELHDKVWGRHNWKDLLDECGSATIIETGDQDDMPGMSDVFYWVAVDDEERFRAELRAVLLDC